jgi:hypothetical protein
MVFKFGLRQGLIDSKRAAPRALDPDRVGANAVEQRLESRDLRGDKGV